MRIFGRQAADCLLIACCVTHLYVRKIYSANQTRK